MKFLLSNEELQAAISALLGSSGSSVLNHKKELMAEQLRRAQQVDVSPPIRSAKELKKLTWKWKK